MRIGDFNNNPAAQIQTRQTVRVGIATELVNAGDALTLTRKSPDPETKWFSNVPYPAPGSSVTNQEVTVTRGTDGSLEASFYTASLVRAGLLSYGQNSLEFMVTNNGVNVKAVEASLYLHDFDLSGVALTGFTRAGSVGSQISDQGDFQGWVSQWADSQVGEVNADSTTVLQSDFFHMINP